MHFLNQNKPGCWEIIDPIRPIVRKLVLQVQTDLDTINSLREVSLLFSLHILGQLVK